MDRTSNFYSQPSYVGGGFPVFSGSRRQRGGSIFGALSRVVLPMLKNFGRRALGHAVKKALGVGEHVLFDTMRGANPRQSLMKHGKQAAKEFLTDGSRTALNTAMSKMSGPMPSRKRAASKHKATPLKKRRKVSTAVKKKTRANF